jgi:hypothetical protein
MAPSSKSNTRKSSAKSAPSAETTATRASHRRKRQAVAYEDMHAIDPKVLKFLLNRIAHKGENFTLAKMHEKRDAYRERLKQLREDTSEEGKKRYEKVRLTQKSDLLSLPRTSRELIHNILEEAADRLNDTLENVTSLHKKSRVTDVVIKRVISNAWTAPVAAHANSTMDSALNRLRRGRVAPSNPQ